MNMCKHVVREEEEDRAMSKGYHENQWKKQNV